MDLEISSKSDGVAYRQALMQMFPNQWYSEESDVRKQYLAISDGTSTYSDGAGLGSLDKDGPSFIRTSGRPSKEEQMHNMAKTYTMALSPIPCGERQLHMSTQKRKKPGF